MRIALLSNVNMNGTIRILKRDNEIYETEGYGNEIGTLMNPSSSLWNYKPEMIILLEDLAEIIDHSLETDEVGDKVRTWFGNLETTLKKDISYYISDAYLWCTEAEVSADVGLKMRIEFIWQKELEDFVKKHGNVRIFPYRKLIENIGEKNAFSKKMWYMGKIMHSPMLMNEMAGEINRIIETEQRIPKKVLALDLDNTLWGGLAGENDITPIVLSDDHAGLAYKNLQRVIKMMKNQGVVLAIVSKNNEEDAMKIIKEHPHMILRPDDFVNIKINWDNKVSNLQKIAKELNLGTDSIVFWDDNATERQIIKDMLPEVTVPDFPTVPEELPDCMAKIWNTYFLKAKITEEDLKKTGQYKENAEREAFKTTAVSFDEYLLGLKIEARRVNPKECTDRITQLLNKTNQFNLMTVRHTENDIATITDDENKKIFVYKISDRFGDYGIVAIAITHIERDTLTIDEFVMSCRIMGKNIENAIIDDIERYAEEKGCVKVVGLFRKSQKNAPVEDLYGKLGYKKDAKDEKTEADECTQKYILEINGKPQRAYCLTFV